VVAKEEARAQKPLQEPPRYVADRMLALNTVPITSLSMLNPGDFLSDAKRPQRTRYEPLQTWRNERIRYKRPAGSMLPEVDGLELNLSPRPAAVPPRSFVLAALQVRDQPFDIRGGVVEGLMTSALKSLVFTLPPRLARQQQPVTVKLAPALGVIHILEGTVRCALRGGSNEEIELRVGDSFVLRGDSKEALVAAKGPGARFRFVQVNAKVVKLAVQSSPLADR